MWDGPSARRWRGQGEVGEAAWEQRERSLVLGGDTAASRVALYACRLVLAAGTGQLQVPREARPRDPQEGQGSKAGKCPVQQAQHSKALHSAARHVAAARQPRPAHLGRRGSLLRHSIDREAPEREGEGGTRSPPTHPPTHPPPTPTRTCALHSLQALELLLRSGEVAQRERDLLRAVPDPDLVNAMLGGVRLQVAGLLKMKQAQRKKK